MKSASKMVVNKHWLRRRTVITSESYGYAGSGTEPALKTSIGERYVIKSVAITTTLLLASIWRAESRHSSHIRCSQSTLASWDKTKLNKTARVLVPPRLLQFAICYSRSALPARLLNYLNYFTKRQAAEDAPARSPRLRETSTRSAIPGRLRFVECLRL